MQCTTRATITTPMNLMRTPQIGANFWRRLIRRPFRYKVLTLDRRGFHYCFMLHLMTIWPGKDQPYDFGLYEEDYREDESRCNTSKVGWSNEKQY